MDMERIKQSLRLRSGRSKASKKLTIAPQEKPLHNQEKEKSHQSVSRPQKQMLVSSQPESDTPSLRIWDRDTALPQKYDQKPQSIPEETPAPPSNGLSSHSPEARPKTAQNQSTRYGRSGIERKPSQAPDQIQAETQKPEAIMAHLSRETERNASSSDEQDFELRPPTSRPRATSMDSLCEMLFSEGHLNILIHDPRLMARFSTFLQRYKPKMSTVVLQYLEYQKAIKAIQYANAVAETITQFHAIQDVESANIPAQENAEPHARAAELSKPFAEMSQRVYDLLLQEALPAYVTYTLVRLSTECLTAEITGQVPVSLTSNLIGGLSEVFCLSDPNLPDNPLIYCSEEFYRLTGYTSGDVLGQNCRFLQGPKTDKNSVRRIRETITKGEPVTETLLNYRRDGRGFVNVLMVAPLEDDKGKVKYFLGAQVDVSRLVAGGWGLESLEKLVQKLEMDEIRGRRTVKSKKDEALRKLRELSEMFDLEESAVVRSHSRSSSMDREEIGSRAASAGGSDRPRQTRRFFGNDGEEGSGSDEDESDDTATENTEKEKSAWNLATTGRSGKLPGIYQSYLLTRPAPSSRIIFVSPALRKKGNITQKPFLSYLAAPQATLSGLKDSFATGTPVTAKVAFMAQPGSHRDGTPTGSWRRTNSKSKNDRKGGNDEKDPSTLGRTCWISATPLLGSDEEIGVWIVVFVDKNSAAGRTLNKTKGQGMQHQQLEDRVLGIAKVGERKDQAQTLSDDIKKDDIPIKPVRVDGTSAKSTPKMPESPSPPEDREAAREMYDNNGNEAVQQEANKDPRENARGDAADDKDKDSTASKTDGSSVEGPLLADGTNEKNKAINNVQTKDEVGFEEVSKANKIDDENSGPGPAEEGDDNKDTFHRRPSQPLTPPNTKERVVLRSESPDAEREANNDTAANDSVPGKPDINEEDSTPTRADHDQTHLDEGYEEGDGSRPATSNSRTPMHMDYLTHPGSGEQRKKVEDGATSSDPDCEVWTPYSVD